MESAGDIFLPVEAYGQLRLLVNQGNGRSPTRDLTLERVATKLGVTQSHLGKMTSVILLRADARVSCHRDHRPSTRRYAAHFPSASTGNLPSAEIRVRRLVVVKSETGKATTE